MARTPNPTTPVADLPALNDTEVRADMVAADHLAAANLIHLRYERITRQAGQIEALEFTRRVADVAQAQIFENLRQSGDYKGMPYLDAQGDTRYIASLEEFCEVKLGKSYRRCLELSQNLRALGPELYEQSERLGLRNVDYKALRALPADDQVLIKQAIEEAKSRDEVLDILQEMAVKHAAEKAALTKSATDARADYEAQQTISKNKQQRIDELERETARIAHLAPDQRLEEMRQKALNTAGMAEVSVRALGQDLEALRAFRADHPGTDAPILAGLLANIELALIGLKNEFGIEDAPIADERPEWVRLQEAGQL